jgi:hypothetical protein
MTVGDQLLLEVDRPLQALEYANVVPSLIRAVCNAEPRAQKNGGRSVST